MATYKVPQDVEAEDKLLGPFTLKQFIYLIIVAICIWLTMVVSRNSFTLIFLPATVLPALFFGFLVFLGYKNPTQPAELYLAAMVRFYFKPHKRIWDQEGVLENVIVTAPKKLEHQYSDGMNQEQVRSRLKSLADVMDSRGWATKNAAYQPNVVLPQDDTDDRLVSIPTIQLVEPTDFHPQDDRWDQYASPLSQSLDSMIAKKQDEFRKEAIEHMNNPNYNPYPAMHQQVIRPLDEQQQPPSPPVPAVEPATLGLAPQEPYVSISPPPIPTPPPAIDPAILELANNDEFSVQTIAHQAQRLQDLSSGDEISLH